MVIKSKGYRYLVQHANKQFIISDIYPDFGTCYEEYVADMQRLASHFDLSQVLQRGVYSTEQVAVIMSGGSIYEHTCTMYKRED